MSSHTEINTDGENFGVLSTPKPRSHYSRGEDLKGYMKSNCLVIREIGTTSSLYKHSLELVKKLAKKLGKATF